MREVQLVFNRAKQAGTETPYPLVYYYYTLFWTLAWERERVWV